MKLEDNLAYTETIHTKHGTDRKYRILTFKEEIKWHRSNSIQTIHILQGSGWQLKLRSEPPIKLEVGKDYSLSSRGACRLIKGLDKLVLRVEELFQPQTSNPIL